MPSCEPQKLPFASTAPPYSPKLSAATPPIVTVASIVPVSPLTRTMSTVPGVFMPEVQTFWSSQRQAAGLKLPCVHATGRWLT